MITEIRTLLGMSQGKLADAVGCTLRSIATYESGRRQIPDDIVESLGHMRATYLATRTKPVVRRAVEDRFARWAPGFSVGAIPDGYLPLVEKAMADIEKMMPPSLRGRDLAVRLSAPTGRLILDAALPPSPGADQDEAAFRGWLRERAAKLTEDSRCTCARCGGPGASMEISGWAWPLCPQHAIKRKESRYEPRAA
jgi:transcriptional regulator with XRE-family HTH domain